MTLIPTLISEKKLILFALLLLFLFDIGVAWMWWHERQQEEGLFLRSHGALFSLASSSGATYVTVSTDGKVGIGASSTEPTTALQVAGALRLTEKSSEGCDANIEGAIAYNPDNGHFWGCDGSAWHILDN